MDNLKKKTAKTLKWNIIDRVSSQVVFALVGIVLANVIPKEDFGLVGALAIFQAFAIIFVDSGFGAALLQKECPDQKDYSTVFWFNLAVSIAVYLLLFALGPVIADMFGDSRLDSLSKVMFLTFVVNGLAIVQTNRLMKRMDVRMVALSNLIGLLCSGVLGIVMALRGYGAWALVAQQLSLAFIKTIILWLTGNWLPSLIFSLKSLREIWGVGVSVFSSQILNTACLNIYNFVIGLMYGMVPLGVYTQAEKWSKMGSASVSQILTSSFVPVLAGAQSDRSRYVRYMHRINRFTSFILFPFMLGLTAIGAPLFHTLFGQKWDEAIPLFQILMGRGIFVVLLSLYSNFLLGLGKSKALFAAEVVKDTAIAVGLLATIFLGDITILVWGQLLSSLLAWGIVLAIVGHSTGVSVRGMLTDMWPFLLGSLSMVAVSMAVLPLSSIPMVQLVLQITVGLIFYTGALAICRAPELSEAVTLLRSKLHKSRQ
ncbi:MAG: lipopolysaccharide biosynthesis protein [Clostridium sp.]|nr:lipopolysaccharide biosynthesis protein [Prevotella sp.]MCM1429003.1 lipopolysaccharide biosynthesis protein [Clostridium sp.]